MKYRPLTEAIITSFLIPNHPTRETFRPFGRYRYVHDRLSVGSMNIPLYPGMFPLEIPSEIVYDEMADFIVGHSLNLKPLSHEVILMETVQKQKYFRMHLHERYDAIDKGTPIS